MLRTFRDLARVVAARRGVRIAKWLGDGVMLVGVDAGPVSATAVELTSRIEAEGIALRGGVASGSCLLFEGDDYIGRCVNLASRLSDVAKGGEVLADANTASLAPDWVRVGRPRSRRIHGLRQGARHRRPGHRPTLMLGGRVRPPLARASVIGCDDRRATSRTGSHPGSARSAIPVTPRGTPAASLACMADITVLHNAH